MNRGARKCRMKADQIEVGRSYLALVSRRPCPVQVTDLESPGIWSAVSAHSGHTVYLALPDFLAVATRRTAVQQDWAKAAAGDVA